MTGLLGTRASLQADANLIFQVVIFLLLILGFVLARKRNLTYHERIMKIVAVLNLASIFLVMVPSIIVSLVPLLSYYPVIGSTVLVHALFGGLAAILGTTWGFRKFRNIKGVDVGDHSPLDSGIPPRNHELPSWIRFVEIAMR